MTTFLNISTILTELITNCNDYLIIFVLDINMVFAVVKNESNSRNDFVHDFYKNFANFIGQPNSVGELTEDEKVMEDLIKEKYRSITSEFTYM